MILSRNWLTKFINLEKITNLQISEALNSLGFEVEQETDYDQLNDKLVIGYVAESEVVPDTHLRLNQVKIGNKTLEIICGAPNVRAGQYVVVAQVGQTIANGLTLTARKIRGYESQGMICALNEIGFSDQVLTPLEADSIYVINSTKDLKTLIGHSINEIGFGDYLWDVDLTLNRSDALAAWQLVKELTNYFNLKITNNPLSQGLKISQNKNLQPKIIIDSQLKNDLNTLVYESLKINNPPTFLNAAEDLLLKTLGVKSSESAIEDLAQISSWETGQPLIVINQNQIKNDLKLTTTNIDGKKLIALKDGDAIVQILGNQTTEEYRVGPNTKNVLVLALNWQESVMRQQQKQLATSSLALQRYMKPLSAHLYRDALTVFHQWLENYQLLEEVAGFKIEKEAKAPKTTLKIELKKIQDLLGLEISAKEVQSLFKTLDFEITIKDEQLSFQIDPHRTDIFGTNDLCEEVARLYGYNNIPNTPPLLITNATPKNLKLQLQDKLSNYLVGVGFRNTKTYSLISEQKADYWNLFNLWKPVKLLDPLSQLRETYRMSLLPSLIETATYNATNNNRQFKLWEIADIYTQNTRQRHLALLTTRHLSEESNLHQVLENNYFYLKGIVEAIFNLYKINLTDVTFELQKKPLVEIHPFINAEIKIKNKTVGFIFRLNPKFENDKKLPPTCYAELNLDLIDQLMNRDYQIQPVSKFQSSARDLSIMVPSSLEYQKLIIKLLQNVEHVVDSKIVDQYQDEAMQKKGEQSLTISFTFNDLTQQMTETEINQQWNQILKNAKKLELVIR